jgi:hypothetical protein
MGSGSGSPGAVKIRAAQASGSFFRDDVRSATECAAGEPQSSPAGQTPCRRCPCRRSADWFWRADFRGPWKQRFHGLHLLPLEIGNRLNRGLSLIRLPVAALRTEGGHQADGKNRSVHYARHFRQAAGCNEAGLPRVRSAAGLLGTTAGNSDCHFRSRAHIAQRFRLFEGAWNSVTLFAPQRSVGRAQLENLDCRESRP